MQLLYSLITFFLNTIVFASAKLMCYLTKIEKEIPTVISNPERIKNAIAILKIYFKIASENIKVHNINIKSSRERSFKCTRCNFFSRENFKYINKYIN